MIKLNLKDLSVLDKNLANAISNVMVPFKIKCFGDVDLNMFDRMYSDLNFINAKIDLAIKEARMFQGIDLNDLRAKLTKAVNIEVTVNSKGGDMFNGFAIYDILDQSGFRIKTIGAGSVMSAAVVILLTGDEILSYDNTRFLIHGLSSCSSGKYDDVKNYTIETKEMQDRIANIIASKTKISRSEIKNMFKNNKEFCFDANKALSLNVINKIIK